MAEELELQQEEEEDSGLSTGAQLGVAAFFMGLPVIGMGFEALGWGEMGLVAAGLAAGSLGIGTKFLLDRKRAGTDEENQDVRPGFTQALAQAAGLDRFQHADWSALLRPMGAPAPVRQIAQQDSGAPVMKLGAEDEVGANIPAQFRLGTETLRAISEVNEKRFVYFGKSATRQVVL